MGITVTAGTFLDTEGFWRESLDCFGVILLITIIVSIDRHLCRSDRYGSKFDDWGFSIFDDANVGAACYIRNL